MYVLGVDLGTTGTKAMLADEKGAVVAMSYKGYPLIKPGKGYVEQRAEDWWEAFVTVVRECTKDIQDKNNIIAISMSSQGGSLVPVDVEGSALANAMVWMDQRGYEQQRELLNVYNDRLYYEKTGWRLFAGLNAVKIKWIKDVQKDIFSRTAKYLTTIDYVNFKLTNKYVIDPSNGAMTQLMDIRERKWDRQILDVVGIREDQLPEILESASVIGNLCPEAAAALGLSTAVKVISGGHDQYCASVGAGAVNNGDILLSTGTAWAVLGIFDKPLFNACTYISPGNHIVKGMWGALATVPTAGVAMEWFRDNFALSIKDGNEHKTESFKEIDEKASDLMSKDEGLFFYPHYNGSGFPRWNAAEKASLLGMGLEHGRYDVARAIMEGVAFEIKGILEEYAKEGCEIKRLRVLGGASRSKLWTEIIANTVDYPTVVLDEANAACVGAAIIAGVGCGMFSGFADGCKKMSGEERLKEIDESKRNFYQNKYERYKKGLEHIEAYYNVTGDGSLTQKQG